jgi:hypothetical protein
MLISKYDPRSVLQTPSFCFSVQSPSLNFKYPTTKDTFHLQREGESALGSACGQLQKMTWDISQMRDEMEELILKALHEEPDLVFDKWVDKWVGLCRESLGYAATNTEAESQGLARMAREIYHRLTSSS